MGARLLLRRRDLGRLRELTEAAWPHEACGLLEADRPGRICRLHALANVHDEPWHRFTIDPEAYLRLEHQVRARGHTIAGVWHSHPHGDPAPSARDRTAAWPGWHYLIAAVVAGRMTALRAWSLGDREAIEAVAVRAADGPDCTEYAP
jgi:proteasome lid subunit RPN8/RPN11